MTFVMPGQVPKRLPHSASPRTAAGAWQTVPYHAVISKPGTPEMCVWSAATLASASALAATVRRRRVRTPGLGPPIWLSVGTHETERETSI